MVSPPSKLHPRWMGPKIVQSRKANLYECLDLISHKVTVYDFSRLKRYYVSSDGDPVWVALHDTDSFLVDSITDHEGDPTRLSALFFRVHWKGYDEDEDSWLPFCKVKELEALDIYLRNFPDLAARLDGK